MSDKVQLRFVKDGPIAVTGEVEVVNENGTVTHMQESTSLCRCGASTNKPFCSGAHVGIKFKAPEGIPE